MQRQQEQQLLQRPQSVPREVVPAAELSLQISQFHQQSKLRFVEFEVWFPPRRDERAAEGFYMPLQEDFYNAYLNSGAVFRS